LPSSRDAGAAAKVVSIERRRFSTIGLPWPWAMAGQSSAMTPRA
jgi:hypothetical protein